MRRGFLICVMLAALIIAFNVAAWTSRGRDALVRIRPSRVVADAFMAAMCRVPTDVETVNWDTRPFDPASLVRALRDTDEARRVEQVRALYVEWLRREPTIADCAQIHQWIGGGLTVEQAARALRGMPEAVRVQHVRQIMLGISGWDPQGWDDPGLRRWVDGPFTLPEIRSRLLAQRPIVGVHYFAWYQPEQGEWRNDLTTVPADSPRPALGFYDSGRVAVIDTHITEIEDAGFDFVIVHIIAQSDRTWRNAHAFVGELAGHHLRFAIMLDGLYDEDAATRAANVERVRSEFTHDGHYLQLQGEPLVMLFSTPLDFAAPGVLLRDVYWTDRYDPGHNTFNKSGQLEPRDWPFWAMTPQPSVNGVVPVIPGYTDAALHRARTMVHPRENGEFYRTQWQRALALHPQVILVYGWNEFFERTAIEPTDAWGTQYLQLTACFIAHAHTGTAGACP
jgi:hypothetical protein